MTCYLLFEEPMKYLVPRGSGRPEKGERALNRGFIAYTANFEIQPILKRFKTIMSIQNLIVGH